jgi:hypothetical protein
MPWQPPSLTVKWGPYQKPDGAEQAKIMELVQAGLGANKGVRILTRELAIEKLRDAGVIETEDIEQLITELDEEQGEADEQARKNAKDLLVDASAVKPAAPAGAARPGGAQPPRVPTK